MSWARASCAAAPFAGPAGLPLLIGQKTLGQRRHRPAGTDDVDSASRRQTTDFVFQTTGQTIGDAGLGRGVVGMSRLAKETGRRTDQDSRRIFQAVSDDAAEKLTQTEKDGGQIDGQRPIPLGQGHLLQRNFLGRPKAGVGHQDLHGAEVGFHGGEETPHLGFLRQIGLDGNAPEPSSWPVPQPARHVRCSEPRCALPSAAKARTSSPPIPPEAPVTRTTR